MSKQKTINDLYNRSLKGDGKTIAFFVCYIVIEKIKPLYLSNVLQPKQHTKIYEKDPFNSSTSS